MYSRLNFHVQKYLYARTWYIRKIIISVNIEMWSTAIEVNKEVVPAEERKKVKLCKEYLAYANSLSYPIRF